MHAERAGEIEYQTRKRKHRWGSELVTESEGCLPSIPDMLAYFDWSLSLSFYDAILST